MNRESTAWVQLAGRVLIGALFIVAGLRKSMGFDASVGYMTKNGVPFAEVLLVLALILEIGGGLLLVLGWKTSWMAIALLVFTAVVTPIFHAYWTMEPAQFGNQLNHFLKNLAIVGGLLHVAILGGGRMSLDGRGKAATT